MNFTEYTKKKKDLEKDRDGGLVIINALSKWFHAHSSKLGPPNERSIKRLYKDCISLLHYVNKDRFDELYIEFEESQKLQKNLF